jgi:hypothetical protein
VDAVQELREGDFLASFAATTGHEFLATSRQMYGEAGACRTAFAVVRLV